MTTHLAIRNGSTELDTFTPEDDLLDVDLGNVADFDYVLATISDIVNGPAYEWDGPQTMRLIAFLASEHLASHSQTVGFNQTDIDAIKEALAR